MNAPSAADPFRWGILATGVIARDFAADLALLPDAAIAAVGSRTLAKADAFGDQFGVRNRHGSYDELVADPAVEAIYVATPHTSHRDAALAAIRAGKAVLVEKPFTVDAAQADELIAAARADGTFLMEAMWTRFLPHIVRLREILADNVLGQIVAVTAEHGWWFPRDPTNRQYNRALGGGALLAQGAYAVSFASMVLGRPSAITAVSMPGFTGVDAVTSMVFSYPSGAQATLIASNYARLRNGATIGGLDARVEIDGIFYRPSRFRVLDRDDNEIEHYDTPHVGHGLRHQAAEVGRCVRAGLVESPVMPLDESVSIMRTMDEVRRQIGQSY